MHLNSELLFTKYAKQYFQTGMQVLEIGPNRIPSAYCYAVMGERPLRNPAIKWDTLNLEDAPLRRLTYCVKDGYAYPIPNDYYDIVLSGQVLEHIPKVWVWIKELARICKKGGHVITINPVSWKHHGVPDCWRVYPDGMRALYEEARIEVLLSVWESLDQKSSDTITIGRKN